MRASDADRDAVAARLREALAEGRINPDEHSERLDAVYGAKTMGELVPITRDLPDAPTAADAPEAPGSRARGFVSPRPVYGAERVVTTPASGHFSIAVMGGAERSGNWTVPATYQAVAIMGGVEIDLREATFAQREVTIWANALMGGIGIIIPDDIDVRVSGAGIMGGYGADGGMPPSVTDPGTPIVHIKGIAVMGAVVVERKPRKHQKQRDDAKKRELGSGD
ncbi:MAG: DUF1707 domain-containing protein [Nocardiopsaceae bacterium]|nr:DUF1707 domain-containing protein [Nocardiopsaceae bacterium]